MELEQNKHKFGKLSRISTDKINNIASNPMLIPINMYPIETRAGDPSIVRIGIIIIAMRNKNILEIQDEQRPNKIQEHP